MTQNKQNEKGTYARVCGEGKGREMKGGEIEWRKRDGWEEKKEAQKCAQKSGLGLAENSMHHGAHVCKYTLLTDWTAGLSWSKMEDGEANEERMVGWKNTERGREEEGTMHTTYAFLVGPIGLVQSLTLRRNRLQMIICFAYDDSNAH